MAYQIRRALRSDLPDILEIYDHARRFMAQNGNPDQWGSVHPPRSLLEEDIRRGELFVLTGEDGIHGVFAFILGQDPSYARIYDGQWHYDAPYGTIHRIAGDGSHGIVHSCAEFCSSRVSYLRIDTHEDNHIMQAAVRKEGFRYCGIIHLENGDPRLAFDRLLK